MLLIRAKGDALTEEHSKNASVLSEDSKQVQEAGFIARNIRALGLNIHGIGISNRLIVGSAKSAFIPYRLFIRLFFSAEKRSRLRKSGSLDFIPFFLCRFASVFGMHDKTFQIALSTYGIKLSCKCKDRDNDYALLTNREYELLDKWFVPKKGDVVIDVGAHIGIYAMVSSRRVGVSGKVIAIEAASSYFKAFQENIRLNGLDNVVAVNCILYSKDMPLPLWRYDAILAAGRRGGIKEQEREQKIQEEQMLKSQSSTNSNFTENTTIEHAMTLDTILQQRVGLINHVNWIKIDVEGAELDVLKGAAKTLATNQNIAVLIEIHRSWLYEPILNLLREYDFTLQG